MRSESLVARPRTMMRRPVALGSRVPQWPTFLMPNWRRMTSTISWEVGPAGLSTSNAPSKASNCCIVKGANEDSFPLETNQLRSGVERFFYGCDDLALDGERIADDARARGSRMPAAAELAGDQIDVHLFALGPEADAGEIRAGFLENAGDHDGLDIADVIDEAL